MLGKIVLSTLLVLAIFGVYKDGGIADALFLVVGIGLLTLAAFLLGDLI